MDLDVNNSIVIEHIVDGERYKVNGYFVYKNKLRNWSCEEDLSDSELGAFDLYEKLIINNPRLKKHIIAVYNVTIGQNLKHNFL